MLPAYCERLGRYERCATELSFGNSRNVSNLSKVMILNAFLFVKYNADCLSWLLVIAEHILGNPEIAAPKDALDGEAQLRRVVSAKGLNVVATADSLARLRILD